MREITLTALAIFIMMVFAVIYLFVGVLIFQIEGDSLDWFVGVLTVVSSVFVISKICDSIEKQKPLDK